MSSPRHYIRERRTGILRGRGRRPSLPSRLPYRDPSCYEKDGSLLKIKKIDHVAVCVADLDGAVAQWRTLFGLVPGAREWVES